MDYECKDENVVVCTVSINISINRVKTQSFNWVISSVTAVAAACKRGTASLKATRRYCNVRFLSLESSILSILPNSWEETKAWKCSNVSVEKGISFPFD